MLYSERRVEFEKLPRFRLFGRKKALLMTYIAIKVATRLEEPLKRGEVDEACREFNESMARYSDRYLFNRIVEVNEVIARLLWVQATLDIARRRFAHRVDEHSYYGAIYAQEKQNRGPISKIKREAVKAMTSEMEGLKRRLEEGELEQLKVSDPVEHDRYARELEELRAKLDFESPENLKKRKEVDELVAFEEVVLVALLSIKSKDFLGGKKNPEPPMDLMRLRDHITSFQTWISSLATHTKKSSEACSVEELASYNSDFSKLRSLFRVIEDNVQRLDLSSEAGKTAQLAFFKVCEIYQFQSLLLRSAAAETRISDLDELLEHNAILFEIDSFDDTQNAILPAQMDPAYAKKSTELFFLRLKNTGGQRDKIEDLRRTSSERIPELEAGLRFAEEVSNAVDADIQHISQYISRGSK